MQQLLLAIPDKLESKRLILQPYAPGDGAWLHKAYLQNQSHLAEGIAGIKAGIGLDLTTQDDAETFVRRLQSNWIMRERFVYAVRRRADQSYVGELWIENRDWDLGLHEIGYFLLQAQVGNGYATEATKAGLAFLFSDLRAKKVALTCDEVNVASYRVAERCGFVREGLLRQENRRADGSLTGKLCYGMLRAEFEQTSSN